MTDFLHGVETFEHTEGTVVVQGVKTAVIALVGTAPVHHVDAANRKVNELGLALGTVDDRKYLGPVVAGYTMPRALEQIRACGAQFVFFVNVFDPDVHKEDVAAADLDITDGEIQLANPDVTTAVVKAAGGAGPALVEGTDYTIDKVTGVIATVVGGALAAAEQANVAYSYGDPAAALAADVIGEVDENGIHSGMQCFLKALSTFGFNPKIFIAPGYSSAASVVSALDVVADAAKTRAIALIDAPVGTPFPDVIAGRGPEGEINFNVASSRLRPCWPHVYVYDRATDANVLAPMSSTVAGVMAHTDQTRGVHVSASNKPKGGIKGIVGLEFPVEFAINNKACQANVLNSVGVTTIINAFGKGYRVWGNRSAAFPGSSSPMAFIQSRRTADLIHESLELAMMEFMDEPLGDPVIKAVLAATNAYVRSLIRRGAVAPGSGVTFDPLKNPADSLSAGRGIFDLGFIPIPPFERATFDSNPVKIELLVQR